MYAFGDSFDLYPSYNNATPTDLVAGYWDSEVSNFTTQPGRFTGGRSMSCSANANVTKSSGNNDTVHHIVCAVNQTTALAAAGSGSVGLYFELLDVSTAQCTVGFRTDGSILLMSAGPTGTVLATYSSAITLINQWFAFEIEVVINNTTGSIRVRTNNATSDSFVATGLNTRNSANNYANKLIMGSAGAVSNGHNFDDILWRSDPASVPWVGDIRCYPRAPASDVQAQFSRISSITANNGTGPSPATITNGQGWYSPIVAGYNGLLTTATISLLAAYSGNIKCSLFSSDGTRPQTVLASATTIGGLAAGTVTFTFPTPVTVTTGTQYWIGICGDTTASTVLSVKTAGVSAYTINATYAAFPANSPTGITAANATLIAQTWSIAPNSNFTCVADSQEDGVTSYVYDSNVGDADFYGIASIGVTPAAVVAVTTRGFAQRSDAGSRSGAVQLKSGSTTVQSTNGGTLSTTFAWVWRTDLTDPATGAAWTPTAVNNIQIGPTVLS